MSALKAVGKETRRRSPEHGGAARSEASKKTWTATAGRYSWIKEAKIMFILVGNRASSFCSRRLQYFSLHSLSSWLKRVPEPPQHTHTCWALGAAVLCAEGLPRWAFSLCIYQDVTTRDVSGHWQLPLTEKKKSQIEDHDLKILIFPCFLFIHRAGGGTQEHMLIECSTTEGHPIPSMHNIYPNWQDNTDKSTLCIKYSCVIDTPPSKCYKWLMCRVTGQLCGVGSPLLALKGF